MIIISWKRNTSYNNITWLANLQKKSNNQYKFWKILITQKYKVIKIKRWIKMHLPCLNKCIQFPWSNSKFNTSFCPLLFSISKFFWSHFTLLNIRVHILDWNILKIFANPLFNSRILTSFGWCMTKITTIEIFFQP